MVFIVEAIRCGRAFDCAQCGELGFWQTPHCEGCAEMVEGWEMGRRCERVVGVNGTGPDPEARSRSRAGVLLMLSGAPHWAERACGSGPRPLFLQHIARMPACPAHFVQDFLRQGVRFNVNTEIPG
eukprot:2225315-Prymnesium_polylepis.1